MFFDRPAQFLYQHHRNLYLPMLAFASEYRYIVRTAVFLAAVSAVLLLTHPSVLSLLGIAVSR